MVADAGPDLSSQLEAVECQTPADGVRSPSWWGRVRAVLRALSLVVIVASCAVVVYLRTQAAAGDFATTNVLTFLLLCFALLALLLNVALAARASLFSRLIRVGLVIVPLCVALSVVRIDHVSGSLVPTFRWRWSPKPDELLAVPQLAPGAVTIDLLTETPQDFPQFLGPHRNLHVPDIKLSHDWNSDRPKQVWRQPIGAGWSGFSVVNGFAVTMEQRGPDELVTCYSVPSGQTLWSHSIAVRHETLAGGVGPRCTPTIHDGLVYALGATGILRCLDGSDGRLVWQDDLLQRAGVTAEEDQEEITWGRSASPLVVDDLVVVPLGGRDQATRASLIAYDRRTGEVRWKGGNDQASYSSPCLATLCGVRQILIVSENSVAGHRPEDGHVLWSYPWPGKSSGEASVSQPVVVAGDRVLLSKAYQMGAELLQIVPESGGSLRAEQLYASRRVLKTKFTNVVVIDGFVYGLSDNIMECVELEGLKSRWKDRRRGFFGHGQVLAAGDVILVQTESGEVVMVQPSPEQLVELGRFSPLNDQTWNNLCLYGPYLLVRNAVEAACYLLPLRASVDSAEPPKS